MLRRHGINLFTFAVRMRRPIHNSFIYNCVINQNIYIYNFDIFFYLKKMLYFELGKVYVHIVKSTRQIEQEFKQRSMSTHRK